MLCNPLACTQVVRNALDCSKRKEDVTVNNYRKCRTELGAKDCCSFLRSRISPFSNEPLTWGQRNLPQIRRLANLLLHLRISYKYDICRRGYLNGVRPRLR